MPEQIQQIQEQELRRPSRWSLFFAVVCLAILLFNPISVLIFFGALSNTHDAFIMYRFSRPFFDYPLPENTIEISRYTKMSYGGSRGCSFVAAKIVQSPLSLEQIREYYADVGFLMPHREPFFMDAEGLLRVTVTRVDENYWLQLVGMGFYEHGWFRIGCY